MTRWLSFAMQNVLRNRRRSLVTMAITAIGAAALLSAGGYATFTYMALADASARDTGNLVLAQRGYFEDSASDATGIVDPADVAARIEALPGVHRVLPRVIFSGLLSNGDRSVSFSGTGLHADEFSIRGAFLQLVEGDLLSGAQAAEALPEVVIGARLAAIIAASPGDMLTLMSTTRHGALNAIDVTVRGTVSTGAPELDERLVLIGISDAQALLGSSSASTLSVYLRDIGQTDLIRPQVASLAPELDVRAWWELAPYFTAVRDLYNRVFGVLGAILAILVLFAVVNTMSMAVVERTREIGTLRALGTHPRQIRRLFTLEGLVIGAAGGLAGALIAAALSVWLAFAQIQMPPPPGRSIGYPLVIAMDPALYALVTALMMAVAAIAAWIVSGTASRRGITEALGHV